MLSRVTFVCVECRVARKGYSGTCGVEGHVMKNVGKRFRAPRKNDTKSWKRFENGDWYTEDSVTDVNTRKTQMPSWWWKSMEFVMTDRGLVPVKGKKVVLNKKRRKG